MKTTLTILTAGTLLVLASCETTPEERERAARIFLEAAALAEEYHDRVEALDEDAAGEELEVETEGSK